MIKVSDYKAEIQGEYYEVMGELTELMKQIRDKYDCASNEDFEIAIKLSEMNELELLAYAALSKILEKGEE